MATTAEDSQLLTCRVCHERKFKRSPRILSCHHSFCESCLLQWHGRKQQEEKLECPVCRTGTVLPPSGVRGLPMDFNVEEMESLASPVLPDSQSCQGCAQAGQTKPACCHCATCDRRLCSDCKSYHQKNEVFKGHVITALETLCEIHGAPCRHLCQTCFIGLCVDCLISKTHDKHGVVDMATGAAAVKEQLSRDSNILQTAVDGLNENLASMINQKGHFTTFRKAIKDSAKACKVEIDKEIEKATETLKHFSSGSHDDVIQEGQSASIKAKYVISDAKTIQREGGTRFISQLPKLVRQMKSMMTDLTKIQQKMSSASVPEPNIPNVVEGDGIEAVIRFLNFIEHIGSLEEPKDYYTSKPRKVLCYSSTDEKTVVEEPRNIAALADGSVIVADRMYSSLARLNVSGNVVSRYYCGEGAKGACVTVHQGEIYILSTDGVFVSKYCRDNKIEQIYLAMPLENVASMAACGERLLFAQPNRTSILMCNTEDGELKSFAKDLKPNFVAAKEIHGSMRVVTSDKTSYDVKVFDQDGKLLQVIGSRGSQEGFFEEPAGVAITDNGHILVADRKLHRVCEFTFGGRFIRQVLSKDHVGFPADIAISAGYIWVNEVYTDYRGINGSIKLYSFR